MMITSFSTSSYAIHADAFKTSIYILPTNLKISLILPSLDFTSTTMDTADYWLMAREYSIWNAAIASLQFWTEDLNPVTLGRATEHVYTTFFYSSTSHTLHQQSRTQIGRLLQKIHKRICKNSKTTHSAHQTTGKIQLDTRNTRKLSYI